MKSDLDALMKERNLDAIMVLGSVQSSPSMYYLLGGGHVSGAAIFKKRDEPAVVYCNAMEREEAAKSGLSVVPTRYGFIEEFTENGREIFEAQGLTSGRIGLYGKLDVGSTLVLLDLFKNTVPDVEFVGEMTNNSILLHPWRPRMNPKWREFVIWEQLLLMLWVRCGII